MRTELELAGVSYYIRIPVPKPQTPNPKPQTPNPTNPVQVQVVDQGDDHADGILAMQVRAIAANHSTHLAHHTSPTSHVTHITRYPHHTSLASHVNKGIDLHPHHTPIRVLISTPLLKL